MDAAFLERRVATDDGLTDDDALTLSAHVPDGTADPRGAP